MKKLHEHATAVLLTFSTLPECSVFSGVHFCSASVASVKLISWGPQAGGRADGKVVRPGSQPLNGISRVLNHRGTQRMSIRTTRFSRRTAPIWTWYGHHLARFSCELFAISHGVCRCATCYQKPPKWKMTVLPYPGYFQRRPKLKNVLAKSYYIGALPQNEVHMFWPKVI